MLPGCNPAPTVRVPPEGQIPGGVTHCGTRCSGRATATCEGGTIGPLRIGGFGGLLWEDEACPGDLRRPTASVAEGARVEPGGTGSPHAPGCGVLITSAIVPPSSPSTACGLPSKTLFTTSTVMPAAARAAAVPRVASKRKPRPASCRPAAIAPSRSSGRTLMKTVPSAAGPCRRLSRPWQRRCRTSRRFPLPRRSTSSRPEHGVDAGELEEGKDRLSTSYPDPPARIDPDGSGLGRAPSPPDATLSGATAPSILSSSP